MHSLYQLSLATLCLLSTLYSPVVCASAENYFSEVDLSENEGSFSGDYLLESDEEKLNIFIPKIDNVIDRNDLSIANKFIEVLYSDHSQYPQSEKKPFYKDLKLRLQLIQTGTQSSKISKAISTFYLAFMQQKGDGFKKAQPKKAYKIYETLLTTEDLPPEYAPWVNVKLAAMDHQKNNLQKAAKRYNTALEGDDLPLQIKALVSYMLAIIEGEHQDITPSGTDFQGHDKKIRNKLKKFTKKRKSKKESPLSLTQTLPNLEGPLENLPFVYQASFNYYASLKMPLNSKVKKTSRSPEEEKNIAILGKVEQYLTDHSGTKALRGPLNRDLTDHKEIETFFPCVGFKICETVFNDQKASPEAKQCAHHTLSAITLHFLLTFLNKEDNGYLEDYVNNSFVIYESFVKMVSDDDEESPFFSENDDTINLPLEAQMTKIQPLSRGDIQGTDEQTYERFCNEVSSGDFELNYNQSGLIEALLFLGNWETSLAEKEENKEEKIKLYTEARKRYEDLLHIEKLPQEEDEKALAKSANLTEEIRKLNSEKEQEKAKWENFPLS